MNPKIGDKIKLLKQYDIGEARFMPGTICIVSKFWNICDNSLFCYATNDKDKEFEIFCMDDEYELLPLEEQSIEYKIQPKIGDKIKFIGKDRTVIPEGTIGIIRSILDRDRITASMNGSLFLLYSGEYAILPEEQEYHAEQAQMNRKENLGEDPNKGECFEYKDIDTPSIYANTSDDPVNSPNHYNTGNIETIDYLESLNIAEDFCAGNAIKYLSRYKHKNPDNVLLDLSKAAWYVNRLIQIVENKSK